MKEAYPAYLLKAEEKIFGLGTKFLRQRGGDIRDLAATGPIPLKAAQQFLSQHSACGNAYKKHVLNLLRNHMEPAVYDKFSTKYFPMALTDKDTAQTKELFQAQVEHQFQEIITKAPVARKAAAAWIFRNLDSYGIGHALRRLQPYMAPLDLIVLAGDVWSQLDNTWQQKWLVKLLTRQGRRGILQFMSPKERRAWLRLPEVIKVWRGCYKFNRSGVSFSLDKEIAENFTKQNRYRADNHTPILIEALVNRSDCVLKLDREEQEVIVLKRNVRRVYVYSRESDAFL